MKTLPLCEIISSDWLKYGFVGLVAVVNLLLYMVISPLIKNDPNKKFWVITFIITSMILLGLGGLYAIHSDNQKFDNKRALDSIAIKNQDLTERLLIYTDKSPEGDTLRARIRANQKTYDSLAVLNDQLSHKVKGQKEIITEFALKTIDQALDNDLTATSGKGNLHIQDVNYKRSRNAVFMNMLWFNANAAILKQALLLYQKEDPEFEDEDINRVVHDLPDLMRIRLKWLKEEAIPQLEADERFLAKAPATQRGAFARVKLPDAVIILKVDDKDGGNTEVVENLNELYKERDLLLETLAKS